MFISACWWLIAFCRLSIRAAKSISLLFMVVGRGLWCFGGTPPDHFDDILPLWGRSINPEQSTGDVAKTAGTKEWSRKG
jgi:hypothetical protein